MEKEAMTEIDSRAENSTNTPPPPRLGCESQDQNQTQEEEEEEEEKEEKNKGIAMMTMLRKKRPFPSPSEADGGDSDSSTVTNPIYVHRVSNLEKMVRVLKRTHGSLRREYWTSSPTSDELRLHHLILIHVTSYISLFDIEQSDDGRPLAFSPLHQEGDHDDPDLDLEELYDALEGKALPFSFANFLQEARKAA